MVPFSYPTLGWGGVAEPILRTVLLRWLALIHSFIQSIQVKPGRCPGCMYSFIDSIIHSFMHTFIRSFIHSCVRSSIRRSGIRLGPLPCIGTYYSREWFWAVGSALPSIRRSKTECGKLPSIRPNLAEQLSKNLSVLVRESAFLTTVCVWPIMPSKKPSSTPPPPICGPRRL